MLTIRAIEEADWAGTWEILEKVFREGRTYPFSPDITEEEAYTAWVTVPARTYVVEDEAGHILGTYYLKPNQPSLGAHICNCGYVVGEKARGRGVASAMCEHSQQEAVSQGYRAMQYNLVVSTNEVAVALWKKLGFKVVGTLPEAFKHPEFGYIDAFVMYKRLLNE